MYWTLLWVKYEVWTHHFTRIGGESSMISPVVMWIHIGCHVLFIRQHLDSGRMHKYFITNYKYKDLFWTFSCIYTKMRYFFLDISMLLLTDNGCPTLQTRTHICFNNYRYDLTVRLCHNTVNILIFIYFQSSVIRFSISQIQNNHVNSSNGT